MPYQIVNYCKDSNDCHIDSFYLKGQATTMLINRGNSIIYDTSIIVNSRICCYVCVKLPKIDCAQRCFGQISSLAIGYNYMVMAAEGSSNVLVTGLNSRSQLGLPTSEHDIIEGCSTPIVSFACLHGCVMVYCIL